MPEKNNKNIIILLILLLLISIIGNIYLYNRTNEIVVEKETIVTKVDSLTSLKELIEKDMLKTTEELERYKGISAKTDSLLQLANAKIDAQKRKINKLMKANADFEILKMRYEELKALKEQYVAQIEELIKENKELKYENTNLAVAVKALEKENTSLSKKVEVASIIKVTKINVKAYKINSRGVAKETEKASKANRITIEVTFEANAIAKAGERKIYFRLIGPDGATISNEDLKSGYFKEAEKGYELPYTTIKYLDYNQEEVTLSADIDQEYFEKGNYKIEIYTDKVLSGTANYTLK